MALFRRKAELGAVAAGVGLLEGRGTGVDEIVGKQRYKMISGSTQLRWRRGGCGREPLLWSTDQGPRKWSLAPFCTAEQAAATRGVPCPWRQLPPAGARASKV